MILKIASLKRWSTNLLELTKKTIKYCFRSLHFLYFNFHQQIRFCCTSSAHSFGRIADQAALCTFLMFKLPKKQVDGNIRSHMHKYKYVCMFIAHTK